MYDFSLSASTISLGMVLPVQFIHDIRGFDVIRHYHMHEARPEGTFCPYDVYYHRKPIRFCSIPYPNRRTDRKIVSRLSHPPFVGTLATSSFFIS